MSSGSLKHVLHKMCFQIIYLIYEGESKSNAFSFSTSIITNTRTCMIHQNEAGPQWILSLFLNMITCSLKSNWEHLSLPYKILFCFGGACGVMVIVTGIGHGDTSSNPGLIAFHIALIPLGKVWIQLFSLQLWVNSRAD